MDPSGRNRPVPTRKIIESDTCTQCGKGFSFWNKPTYCRSCGRAFCIECCSRKVLMPTLGYTWPVKCCDACLVQHDPIEKIKSIRSQIDQIVDGSQTEVELAQDILTVGSLPEAELVKLRQTLRVADDSITRQLVALDNVKSSQSDQIREMKKSIIAHVEKFLARVDSGARLLNDLIDPARRATRVRASPLVANHDSPVKNSMTLSRTASPKSPMKPVGLKSLLSEQPRQ